MVSWVCAAVLLFRFQGKVDGRHASEAIEEFTFTFDKCHSQYLRHKGEQLGGFFELGINFPSGRLNTKESVVYI